MNWINKMEDVLEKMLNSVLIIPFQKDFTSRLGTLCESYAKTIGRDEVEDCVLAFLYSRTNSTLYSYIIEQYQEQFDDTVKLPSVVYCVLSGYVLHILIMDEDEQFDDAYKMQYSLIVRNMMIAHKNSHDQLLTPAFVTQLYSFSDIYQENMSLVTEPENKQIVPDIFDYDSFEEMEVTPDESLFDEIKELAKQAQKLKYQELVNEIKEKNINDPFMLAYYAANVLVINSEWKFVDSYPVKTLMGILPTNRKSLKLKNIKAKLSNSEYCTTYETSSKSSILFNYINGNDSIISEMSELQFSDLEFAIYIYYEFFLEELITD